MRMVVFFEGRDCAGKTTQINLLKTRNENAVENVPDLAYFEDELNKPSEDLFKWWFMESEYGAFCDTLYSAYRKRAIYIGSINKPFILVDKGLKTLETRMLSSLLTRGLALEKAKAVMEASKEKIGVAEEEGLHIYLKYVYDLVDQVASHTEKEDIYKQYQKIYEETSGSISYPDNFCTIDEKMGVEELHERILKEMTCYSAKCIKNLVNDVRIIGLSGMSESGKSAFGKILDQTENIWNLKLVFFVEKICEKYQLCLDEFYKLEQHLSGILIGESLNSFLLKHYYKKCVSIESIHAYTYSACFDIIFGDCYYPVYMQTDFSERITRETKKLRRIGVQAIDDAIREEVLQKDLNKINHGISDFEKDNKVARIDNNRQFFFLYDSVLSCKGNLEKYSGKTLNLETVPCPGIYKEEVKKTANLLEEQLKKEIKGLLLTGSCYSGNVIEGFSDIDFLVILREIDRSVLMKIEELAHLCSIKVGYTAYTEAEFVKGYIDEKTKINMWRMKQGELKPIFWDNSLVYPVYDEMEIEISIRKTLPGWIQTARREIAQGCDIKKLIKAITIIMKILLFSHQKTYMNGYDTVFKHFAEMTAFEKYDIVSLIGDLHDDRRRAGFIEYCDRVLSFIQEGAVNVPNKEENI